MHMTTREKRMIFIAFITVIITILVVVFSEDAFYAALEGLRVWWEIVFPSLLPFFIIAEILMGLGVVHFLGALLEPLMRPIFKVPGVGAFAMAMGLASGYPIGAKITANLRRKKLCTKTEAERLISFTNTADPLFMIGAVAVGMFHRADLALIIAGAHYLSSLLIGFIMRFYQGDEKYQDRKTTVNRKKNIFINALRELISARKNDGRSLGELLGDSVRESVNTLLLIGGFIILFSVITEIITVTGFINIISHIVMFILSPFGLSQSMVLPFISGIFEITNGSNLASQAGAPLIEKLIVVNAIIAWSGLSVHGQVASMIKGTDIKLKPYIFARIMQSLLAGFMTVILYLFTGDKIMATFSPLINGNFFNISYNFITVISLIGFILLITFVLSLLIYLLQQVKIIFFHYH